MNKAVLSVLSPLSKHFYSQLSVFKKTPLDSTVSMSCSKKNKRRHAFLIRLSVHLSALHLTAARTRWASTNTRVWQSRKTSGRQAGGRARGRGATYSGHIEGAKTRVLIKSFGKMPCDSQTCKHTDTHKAALKSLC